MCAQDYKRDGSGRFTFIKPKPLRACTYAFVLCLFVERLRAACVFAVLKHADIQAAQRNEAFANVGPSHSTPRALFTLARGRLHLFSGAGCCVGYLLDICWKAAGQSLAIRCQGVARYLQQYAAPRAQDLFHQRDPPPDEGAGATPLHAIRRRLSTSVRAHVCVCVCVCVCGGGGKGLLCVDARLNCLPLCLLSGRSPRRSVPLRAWVSDPTLRRLHLHGVCVCCVCVCVCV